jgi:hypothetical protein
MRAIAVGQFWTEWRVIFTEMLIDDPAFARTIEYWMRDNVEGSYGTDFMVGAHDAKFLREDDARLCYMRFA